MGGGEDREGKGKDREGRGRGREGRNGGRGGKRVEGKKERGRGKGRDRGRVASLLLGGWTPLPIAHIFIERQVDAQLAVFIRSLASASLNIDDDCDGPEW